jgi:hypothetical protein
MCACMHVRTCALVWRCACGCVCPCACLGVRGCVSRRRVGVHLPGLPPAAHLEAGPRYQVPAHPACHRGAVRGERVLSHRPHFSVCVHFRGLRHARCGVCCPNGLSPAYNLSCTARTLHCRHSRQNRVLLARCVSFCAGLGVLRAVMAGDLTKGRDLTIADMSYHFGEGAACAVAGGWLGCRRAGAPPASARPLCLQPRSSWPVPRKLCARVWCACALFFALHGQTTSVGPYWSCFS